MTIVEAYESRHPDHRIEDKVDPVEAIKFHVWEILNRTRVLSLVQIRALSRNK